MSQHRTKKSGFITIIIAIVLVSLTVIIPGCKKNTNSSGSYDTGTQEDTSVKIPVTAEERQENNPFPVADVKPGATLQQIADAAITWAPELTSQYGKDAPDLALKDLKGVQHRLSDYKGRNVMVVFWATWCPPCRQEIPHLILLQNRMPEGKLKILAVTDEKPQQVSSFVEKNNINYTVLLADRTLPDFFMAVPARGIPSAAFIDPQGKIKFVTSGLLSFEDTRAILAAPH